MRPGLALKPATGLDVVMPFVPDVDMVLVMTVEPGFGGQQFMPDMMAKVEQLRSHFPELDIEVDGGVGPATIAQAADACANLIVSGSAVTGSATPAVVMRQMRDRVTQALSARKAAGNP